MKNYRFTRNWFERHIPDWEKILRSLKNKKINVLDIGVFEGRATVWILDELFQNPDSKLIAIDPFESTFEGLFSTRDNKETYKRNIKESGKENQVVTIGDINYFDALTKLNQEKREKFDFIHVDGSHGACYVLANAILSWNLLKEGGIMILDDYEWDHFEEEYNNPRIAIDSFLKSYQSQLEIIHKHFQIAVKKVIKKVSRTPRDDKTID
jgi:predicted O-methyltransferase YrrM